MNLPPHCRIRSGSVYYVRKVNGKVPWVKLGRVSEGEPAIRNALQALLHPVPRTMADVLAAFWGADQPFRPKTERQYRAATVRLQAVFGRLLPNQLSSSMIAQYLEARGGPIANREIAALSTICNFAMRRGWMQSNPCYGVRRNRERPSNRYVRDEELLLVLEKAPQPFADLLRAAYMTGMRQGDLRALRKDQIEPEGLVIEESKTGKRLVVRWAPGFKVIVERSAERSRCDRIFTNSRGKPWTEAAILSAMRRLKPGFTFHALRAKAESDHPVGLGLLSRYKRARRVDPVR